MPRNETLETTFSQLGILVTPDVTATLQAPLSVTKRTTPSGEVFLAVVQRPMTEGLLAYLPNSLAKRRDSDLFDYRGIVGDIDLPKRARHPYAKQEIKDLDKGHRNSFFGPQYVEMDKYHCERLIRAFQTPGVSTEIIRLVAFFQNLHPRTIDGLMEDTENQNRLRKDGELADNWFRTLNSYDFKLFGRERFRELNERISRELTEAEKRLLIIGRHYDSKTIVDFASGQIYPALYFTPQSITLSGTKLRFTELSSYSGVTAQFRADIAGMDISWSLEDYSLLLRDQDKSLFDEIALVPVLAWRKLPHGQRQYISQLHARKFSNFPRSARVSHLAGI